jgi:hypothetical protein
LLFFIMASLTLGANSSFAVKSDGSDESVSDERTSLSPVPALNTTSKPKRTLSDLDETNQDFQGADAASHARKKEENELFSAAKATRVDDGQDQTTEESRDEGLFDIGSDLLKKPKSFLDMINSIPAPGTVSPTNVLTPMPSSTSVGGSLNLLADSQDGIDDSEDETGSGGDDSSTASLSSASSPPASRVPTRPQLTFTPSSAATTATATPATVSTAAAATPSGASLPSKNTMMDSWFGGFKQ